MIKRVMVAGAEKPEWLVYCDKCKRMLCKITSDGRAMLRHKGREIEVQPDSKDSCCIRVKCEAPDCGAVTVFRL